LSSIFFADLPLLCFDALSASLFRFSLKLDGEEEEEEEEEPEEEITALA